MAKKPIPDAWDDDWEAQADAAEAEVENTKIEEVKITKAERLAQHAETNRKIWESAFVPPFSSFLAIPFVLELINSVVKNQMYPSSSRRVRTLLSKPNLSPP